MGGSNPINNGSNPPPDVSVDNGYRDVCYSGDSWLPEAPQPQSGQISPPYPGSYGDLIADPQGQCSVAPLFTPNQLPDGLSPGPTPYEVVPYTEINGVTIFAGQAIEVPQSGFVEFTTPNGDKWQVSRYNDLFQATQLLPDGQSGDSFVINVSGENPEVPVRIDNCSVVFNPQPAHIGNNVARAVLASGEVHYILDGGAVPFSSGGATVVTTPDGRTFKFDKVSGEIYRFSPSGEIVPLPIESFTPVLAQGKRVGIKFTPPPPPPADGPPPPIPAPATPPVAQTPSAAASVPPPRTAPAQIRILRDSRWTTLDLNASASPPEPQPGKGYLVDVGGEFYEVSRYGEHITVGKTVQSLPRNYCRIDTAAPLVMQSGGSGSLDLGNGASLEFARMQAPTGAGEPILLINYKANPPSAPAEPPAPPAPPVAPPAAPPASPPRCFDPDKAYLIRGNEPPRIIEPQNGFEMRPGDVIRYGGTDYTFSLAPSDGLIDVRESRTGTVTGLVETQVSVPFKAAANGEVIFNPIPIPVVESGQGFWAGTRGFKKVMYKDVLYTFTEGADYKIRVRGGGREGIVTPSGVDGAPELPFRLNREGMVVPTQSDNDDPPPAPAGGGAAGAPSAAPSSGGAQYAAAIDPSDYSPVGQTAEDDGDEPLYGVSWGMPFEPAPATASAGYAGDVCWTPGLEPLAVGAGVSGEAGVRGGVYVYRVSDGVTVSGSGYGSGGGSAEVSGVEAAPWYASFGRQAAGFGLNYGAMTVCMAGGDLLHLNDKPVIGTAVSVESMRFGHEVAYYFSAPEVTWEMAASSPQSMKAFYENTGRFFVLMPVVNGIFARMGVNIQGIDNAFVRHGVPILTAGLADAAITNTARMAAGALEARGLTWLVRAGEFAGRAVSAVGWGLIAYDAVSQLPALTSWMASSFGLVGAGAATRERNMVEMARRVWQDGADSHDLALTLTSQPTNWLQAENYLDGVDDSRETQEKAEMNGEVRTKATDIRSDFMGLLYQLVQADVKDQMEGYDGSTAPETVDQMVEDRISSILNTWPGRSEEMEAPEMPDQNQEPRYVDCGDAGVGTCGVIEPPPVTAWDLAQQESYQQNQIAIQSYDAVVEILKTDGNIESARTKFGALDFNQDVGESEVDGRFDTALNSVLSTMLHAMDNASVPFAEVDGDWVFADGLGGVLGEGSAAEQAQAAAHILMSDVVGHSTSGGPLSLASLGDSVDNPQMMARMNYLWQNADSELYLDSSTTYISDSDVALGLVQDAGNGYYVINTEPDSVYWQYHQVLLEAAQAAAEQGLTC